ncbi:MAG: phosphate ABC transporter substrate-binding protein PstS [Sciscionella sp.]
MNIKRHGAVLGVVALGALLLTACGSDNNAAAGGAPASHSNIACGGKKTLKADGSTAQQTAMDVFSRAYGNDCPGYSVDYSGGGSGQGVKDFSGKLTDFGGSDSPLTKPAELSAAKQRCDGNASWNLPMVFGPIAVTYNVKGVKDLALDGATLAKVFSGAISNWNDPAIKKLNPGKTLPNQKIAVIYRSDESGTTDNFQKYLTAAGGWAKGTGKTFRGGVGEGAKGNAGTSQALSTTDGGITYNEWAYARQHQLATAKIVNAGGGDPVPLTADSAGKAVQAAEVRSQGGKDLTLNLASIYGTKAQGAYPIILATYEVVCSKYTDAATGKAVKAFLTAAAKDGQGPDLAKAGYVPLPGAFKSKLLASVSAIQAG